MTENLNTDYWKVLSKSQMSLISDLILIGKSMPDHLHQED